MAFKGRPEGDHLHEARAQAVSDAEHGGGDAEEEDATCEELRSNMWHPEAINGNQAADRVAVRGDQKQSEAIRHT